MPGSHANAVNIRLMRNVVPNPCFIKTAKGGKSMFKTTVTNDIFDGLRFILIKG